MRIFMAGAAAIALAASGAYAQGNGNGQSKGNDNNAAQGSAQNSGGKKADRGLERGNQERSQKPDRGPSRADQVDRRGIAGDDGRLDRRPDNRGSDNGNDFRVRYDERGNDRRSDRGGDRDVRISIGERDLDWIIQDRSRDFIPGCPPGLAKKRNGCNPPGQVKDRYALSPYGFGYRPGLFGLIGYDRRGGYYYNDGYLVRYGNDGGIASWIPLLGGALAVGNLWPSSYQSYRVPDYYVDYYDLGGPDRYRYADNVIYRVDPEDAAIVSVAALITGDDIRVGQPMPRGYDVYNVPYGYRDRYYDTPEYSYRYSDGYIYQVDPETQLVAAVIDLLI